MTKRHL
jgi:hypothetical protein